MGVLMAHGLHEVVETPIASALIEAERKRVVIAKKEAAAGQVESSSSLSPTAVSKEDREVIRQSQRAYGALLSVFGADQMKLTEHVAMGDAAGLWSVLLSTYERQSVATRVQLIERVFASEMTRGMSVTLYVSHLTGLDRKLQEQGEAPLSSSILLYLLLRGLPSPFQTVVTLLKMREKLTFDEAVEALKNEEERLKLGTTPNSKKREEHAALFAGRANGGCFTCNQNGHVQYDCPMNKNKKRCTRCRRVGHKLTECRAVTMAGEEAPAGKRRSQEQEANFAWMKTASGVDWGEEESDDE